MAVSGKYLALEIVIVFQNRKTNTQLCTSYLFFAHHTYSLLGSFIIIVLSLTFKLPHVNCLENILCMTEADLPFTVLWMKNGTETWGVVLASSRFTDIYSLVQQTKSYE